MANIGYCLAYRKAWKHPAFNNLREAAIWNFLYQNAFYEDGECNFNNHTFSLKRGQIAVSPSFLAVGFGMSEKGVRMVMQKLKKYDMIKTKGTNKGTIITICNYEEYQLKKTTKGEQEGRTGARQGRDKGDNNNKLNKTINKENNPLAPTGGFNFLKWNSIRLSLNGGTFISSEDRTYFEIHKKNGNQELENWKTKLKVKKNGN